MDVLAVLRLSRAADESTSIDRQRDVVNRWAGSEHSIVGEALDLGVSGTVSPFDREGLGPWLTDSPPEPWAGLVVWKLDRLSRNALDTLRLVEWLEQRGKFLVAVADGIDTRAAMGRLFVQLSAIFAELERTTIRERILASRAELRARARWAGEAVHYGLQAVPLDGGGYRLDLDPVGVGAIESAAQWVLDGRSVAEAARRLTEAGYLTPRDRQRELRGQPLQGGEWRDQTLWQILRSRTLLGWTVHKGEADPNNPKSPPILSADTFRRLQVELDRRTRAKTRNPGSASAPLSGVALCWECLEPLWHRAQHVPAGRGRQKTPKTYRYYYCKTKGHTRQIRADQLEELCLRSFLHAFAGVEVTERVVIPPTDHSHEIAEAQLAVEEVSRALASARSGAARSALLTELSVLDARLVELESEPADPGGVRWESTGRTWKEELSQLDENGQRDLWLRVGFGFAARSNDDGFTLAFQPAEGSDLHGLLPGKRG